MLSCLFRDLNTGLLTLVIEEIWKKIGEALYTALTVQLYSITLCPSKLT